MASGEEVRTSVIQNLIKMIPTNMQQRCKYTIFNFTTGGSGNPLLSLLRADELLHSVDSQEDPPEGAGEEDRRRGEENGNENVIVRADAAVDN